MNKRPNFLVIVLAVIGAIAVLGVLSRWLMREYIVRLA
jgi:hypothetical protein